MELSLIRSFKGPSYREYTQAKEEGHQPLAAGGQSGVERGLLLLRTELERTMALLGCDRVEKLGERYIQHRP